MNLGNKLLIVDDSDINRFLLREVFRMEYELLEAENGVEAIRLLRQYHEDIAAVVLDIMMPKMNGYELLGIMRKNPELADIPVVVITANRDAESEIEALEMGADDFVGKPYDPRVIQGRVRNIVQRRETEAVKLENKLLNDMAERAKHDPLTGMYTRGAFIEALSDMLRSDEKLAIVCFSIRGYKRLTDMFGKATGDKLLYDVGHALRHEFDRMGACGRLGNDLFAICLPAEQLSIEALERLSAFGYACENREYEASISIGVYEIDDKTLAPEGMIHRARLGMSAEQGIGYFNEALLAPANNARELAGDMNDALINKQFDIRLQPQYDIETGEIVGAEALARWPHPQRGTLMPYEFMPVFESNGFAAALDEYVWDRVCQTLKAQLDAGLSAVPIAVNLSHVDICSRRLVSELASAIDKRGLPASLLSLEISEAASEYAPEITPSAVEALSARGFSVYMDGFGRGSASLSALTRLPLAGFKPDMLNVDEHMLKALMTLANAMGLRVVAQRVETREQEDMLRRAGCRYAQGFLYAKPMSVDEFDKLLK